MTIEGAANRPRMFRGYPVRYRQPPYPFSARQPMSWRQKPSGQSISLIAA